MARELKDSGIEWIGQIPKEWEVCRFKNFLSLFSIPSTSEKKIGLENIESETGKFIKTEGKFEGNGTHFCKGDILYGKLRPYLKKVWVSTFEGNAVGDFFVFRVKDNACSNYIKWLLLSDGYTEAVNSSVYGAKMPRVSSEFIMTLPFYLPSFLEQQKIADYLDKLCGEVDEMVTLQETMIEELKAYKQSVITEAVTKGQNPNAPMRDSGIDWIGEIPEHWEIAKMKFLCTYIKDGTHFSPEIVNDGYPYITATDVRGIGLNYDMAKKVSKETFIELQKAGCQPRKGDVLLVKDGATTGRTGLMVDDTECVLLSSVAMLRPNKSVCQLYLMYLLMSDMMQSQIQLSMAGTALPRITLTKLTNFLGIIPPFEEQQQIVSYLDTKCSEIDSLIALKQAKIEELKEYKKSVIYEYVTGKKEVV